MFASVLSGVVRGLESRMITVEADVTNGLPQMQMVGYLSSEVREAQERVRSAMQNCHLSIRPMRVVINLSPADIRKAGSGFDLPIAVALMIAYGYLPQSSVKDIFFAGELSLNGELNGIHGMLGLVEEARQNGCRACIVPEDNAAEAAMVQGIEVYGAFTLKEVFDHLSGAAPLWKTIINIEEILQKTGQRGGPDFKDVKGQAMVRRAAEIAAAGRHNLLISGPPGAGKSMIAKRIPSILPPVSADEALEISRIHSVAGTLPPEGLVCERPFRMPHHTISVSGLAGGGMIPKPGEISLAHRGVLYLDEIPEFRSETIEILRQPMEDHAITITRNVGTYVFPADFMLVASRNPCKCGYYPDRSRCRCSEKDVRRYLQQISRPLLDRIDLHVTAEQVPFEDLQEGAAGESSESIRARVEKAHAIQTERYKGTPYRFNGELDANVLEKYCLLGEKEKNLMARIYEKKQLTARTYHKILKTARTIADLEGKEKIEEKHLAEAALYRPDAAFGE